MYVTPPVGIQAQLKPPGVGVCVCVCLMGEEAESQFRNVNIEFTINIVRLFVLRHDQMK